MYGQLYRSETIHEMSVRDYLVPLVESALESYHSPVQIELKHAFAGRHTGRLSVSLHRSEDEAVLTVADDGVGMPEWVDPTNSTEVGLTVVQAVVQQLNGELTVERAGGTVVSIRFPVTGR